MKVWLRVRMIASGVVLLCATAQAAADSVFARVEGETITRAEYEAAVSVAVRQSFYHGLVDDERLAKLRHRVAGEMVDQLLLRHEAQRQGIKVDAAAIEKEMASEAARYHLKGLPQEQRRHLDEMLRRQSRESLLLRVLEQKVKALPDPSESEIRAYYAAHMDKFTTPPQLRLALILLKVEPSAPVESWRAAQQEAQRLRRKLAEGADFAGLARLHSGDASAERGGDLGFVHQGMLAEEAQQAVDALRVGEVAAPVNLLQGVALFKLLERRPEVENPFEQVSARAKGLLQRERSERAWGGLLQSLRSKAQIEIVDKEITTEMMWADVPTAKR